jgi:peptide/nickel transport system substrate-binding protein
MLKVVPEASVRAIALETGDAHSSVWNLLPLDNERLSRAPGFTAFRMVDVPLNLIALNNMRPQLSDRRVRQAMMYAIDRERIVREVFRGQAVVATANMSPTVKFYYEPNVKKYPYDPREAEKLLEEAGWRRGADGVREKGGQKLEFTLYIISGDMVRKPQAEAVQRDLRAVGIRMDIREAPWATNYSRMLAGEIDAALFNWTHGGWDGEPDATSVLSCRGATNFHRFCRTRVDQLLAAGAREVDPEKRRPIYAQIQKIVAEEVPMLYMTFWHWFQIFSPRVKGLPKEALLGPRLYRLAWQWWLE